MKVFLIVLFSVPALGLLRGNENPLSTQTKQGEPRSGNEALQQFKMAQKTGDFFGTAAHQGDASAAAQKTIQVDLSETSTAFQIMVYLDGDSIEEDFSMTYRDDGRVKVRRKNSTTPSAKSSEVTVKIPGPTIANLVTRFTRDGKLVFNLPKASVASVAR